MAQITIPIQFDEDKLKELVKEAVERLKAEGYIWKPSQTPENWRDEVLSSEGINSPGDTLTLDCGGANGW